MVDTDRHPMAAANEPRAGERANLAMRQLNIVVSQCDPNAVRLIGGLCDARRVVRCCALVACRPITEGEELTWHYGRGYAPLRLLRGYRAGGAGRLSVHDSDLYQILNRWGRPLPVDAVDGIVGRSADASSSSTRPRSPTPHPPPLHEPDS